MGWGSLGSSTSSRVLWYSQLRMRLEPELFDARGMAVLISFLTTTVRSVEASAFWIAQKVLNPGFSQPHALCNVVGWDFLVC